MSPTAGLVLRHGAMGQPNRKSGGGGVNRGKEEFHLKGRCCREAGAKELYPR